MRDFVCAAVSVKFSVCFWAVSFQYRVIFRPFSCEKTAQCAAGMSLISRKTPLPVNFAGPVSIICAAPLKSIIGDTSGWRRSAFISLANTIPPSVIA